MDRGQTLSEGAVFLASISIAAVVALGVTALVDPPIVAEPVVEDPVLAAGYSLAAALIIALVATGYVYLWPRGGRAQITGGPIVSVGFGVAALVSIVVGLEVAEYQRANTPPGADLGAPPTLTIGETALAVVLLLVVLGGVVVLSRRVGE